MQYDLHVHTAERSPCSCLPAEELCRLAVVLGLRGVALTEHDQWWPESGLIDLHARYPALAIFHGMERTCQEGHFLVFLPTGMNDRSQPPDTVYDLAPWVHARGGLVVWAHPFRFEGPVIPPWLDSLALDGIEIASSNMDFAASDKAAAIAAEMGLTTFTNSDAHDAATLGYYTNFFDAELTNGDELITYLQQRRVGR